MVKIAWKTIKGYGPYAYLQQSVKLKSGEVVSKHLAYLGKAGAGGLVPGKGYTLGPEVKGHGGTRVAVPEVPEKTLDGLNPGPLKTVHWMKQQVDAGTPKAEISTKPPPDPKTKKPGPPKAGAPEPSKAAKTAKTSQTLGQAVSSAKVTGTETKAETQKAAEKIAAKIKDAGLEGKVTAEQVTATVEKAVQEKKVQESQAEKGKAVSALAAAIKDKLPTTPQWTKVGPKMGNTPGGICSDQLGHKHYVKRPPSHDHVKNELLARDLYRLAGVKVLEARETELDGRPAIASRMVNMVKCGTNPKDVPGAVQGFAADAWLANWDSVGVGSTKYDNICTVDGEAYRVDTGGALRYRGAGASKGAAFGNKVTELDKLRDPQVNPVAASVFGDMTLDQIEASAKPILNLSDEDIRKTVAKHYDGAKGKALADKLIARADYIAEWLEKEAPKDAKVLASEAAGGAGLPKGGVPKVDPAYVYKDNKGKPYITSANIKKLEKAAATGDQNALHAEATAMADKMLSSAKKSTVWAVAAHLKGQIQGVPVLEGDGGSGLAETMDQVDQGKVKLPKQAIPSPKVVEAQQKAVLSGKKDYDKDLEQVSGQKGSNEGGLFKDKKLQTLHYVKWPNSEVRAKVEALTASMYAYAQVPVPTVRQVTVKGKPAVISDWIEGAAPMTAAAMAKHEDVRTGFAADAWLANWDVVGLSADNIVKGPGAKAYRIDLGGSVLFRAQGKPKAFDEKVGELETLRNPSVNPKAAAVFQDMTPSELREGAERVGDVSDGQIDEAVDAAGLPKKSADYPASQFGAAADDLPKLLKARLKARRDYVVAEILHAAEKAEALEKEKEKAAKEAEKDSWLKLASVKDIVKTADQYTPSKPKSSSKWALAGRVMKRELGEKEASGVTDAVKAHYSTWKGSANTGKGAVLRYAAGEMEGTGRREARRLKKYHQFMVKEKLMGKGAAESHAAQLDASTGTEQTKRLVEGLRVTRRHNALTMKLKHPGKDTLTLYRGWKPDQVKYLKLQKAKVGQVLSLEDPPLYSWSLDPKVGHSFGHGSLVTRSEVPIDNLVLSDTVNSVGSYEGENEVLFKGVPTLKTEVVKTK